MATRRSGSAPVEGEVVGRWTLGRVLGAGGMATVWRATSADGVVALKILHQARVTQEETRRMKREYLTLARLDHPRIVKVIDAGEHQGFPWLALQYVPGRDLGALIESWKASPPPDRFEQAERITRELCDALAYVHSRGIIHRDLKPGNVLVDDGGTAWLTDFGVVKDVESFHTNLTVAGRLVGTVAFMAPEQITGDPVDARADLYGLGALLYAMLTGRRPVVADSIAAYLARQLAEKPKAPVEIDPRVPLRLDRVAMRLLEKEPSARYATATEVLAALDAPAGVQRLPVHGQGAALAALDQLLDALEAGAGGMVVVVGPPGSGRTRFLEEAGQRAVARGLDARRVGTAYAAAPGVTLGDDAAEAGPAERQDVAREVEAVLAGEPRLLVLSATPDALPRVAEVVNGAPLMELSLGPLSRDALRALLRDVGAAGGLGAALARRLETELGGLAGACVRQVDALIEGGWLGRGPDGSLRAPRGIDPIRTEPLPIPDAERQATLASLGRLGRQERSIVDAIAVLGMPSSTAVVAATAGVPDAGGLVAALVRAGLVTLRMEGLHDLVSPTSPRLAQVVREALPPPRARALHAAAAHALRQRYAQRGAAIAELVAHHLEHAGQAREARPLLLQAAQTALRKGEPRTARGLAERAIVLEEAQAPGAEEAKLRRQARALVGDAYRAEGRLRQAVEAYGRALAEPGTPAEQARLVCAAAACGIELGEVESSAPDLHAGLAALPKGEPAWVESVSLAATLAQDAGDADSAEAWLTTLAEFANDARDHGASLLADVVAQSLSERDTSAPGAARRCMARWQALYAEAVRLGRTAAIVATAGHLGRVLADAGESAAVGALADELAQAGERLQSLELEMIGHGLRATVLHAAGDHAGAQRAAGEALAPLRAVESREALVIALVGPVLADQGPDGELGAWARGWLSAGGLRPCPPLDAEALRQALLAAVSEPVAGAGRAREVLGRAGGNLTPASARVRRLCAVALRRAGLEGEATAATRGVDEALSAAGWSIG